MHWNFSGFRPRNIDCWTNLLVGCPKNLRPRRLPKSIRLTHDEVDFARHNHRTRRPGSQPAWERGRLARPTLNRVLVRLVWFPWKCPGAFHRYLLSTGLLFWWG